ncbi:MAG TPA: hypothetical protein VLB02_02770 [Candidatus Paceibacterota bacterium]|nr:hypothetical protein [Candidatus Paceibacterota bacterium]
MRKTLVLRALLLVLFIFAVNALAMKFYWYTAMLWFDMPMHFLGGVFLALATGVCLSRQLLEKPFRQVLPILLISVLCFGVLWELFEYSVQTVIRFAQLANIPDSFSDLFFDMLGGSIGAIFVYRLKRRYNRARE